ncbi:MAG: YdcF family protein [Myxococcaceae bacterium]
MKETSNRAIRFILCALGVLTAGVFGLTFVVDRFGQKDARRASPVIVVLGARVLEGGVPSSALYARVAHGVALYRQGLAPLLLFSGGVGSYPPSEAQAMLKMALAAGVPREACLLEEESHSTEENADFSAKLLQARGIHEVLLVSDPYHLLRATRYFRRAGLTPHASPALMTERNIRWPDRLYWTVREAFALLTRPKLWFVN